MIDIKDSEDIASQKFRYAAENLNFYSEAVTDETFTFKNISFDFSRTYSSVTNSWFFSVNSKLEVLNEKLIRITFPDASVRYFVKQNDKYVDEFDHYELDEIDNGYSVKLNGVTYTFDKTGYISSIYSDENSVITFTRAGKVVIVSDMQDRSYSIRLSSDNSVLSINNPDDNSIKYTYASSNLVKVVDEAGVTIGSYAYADNRLSKSGFLNVSYYADGRLESLKNDDGSATSYSYSNDNSTVETSTNFSDDTSKVVYNEDLMVAAVTENDSTTEYSYNEQNQLVSETNENSTTTYTYNDNGYLISQLTSDDEDSSIYYTYDDSNNLIRQQAGSDYSYYSYDDNGNCIVSASLKEDYEGEAPDCYDSSLDCFDEVKYAYNSDNLVVKTESSDIITEYTYDDYGNAVKTVTTDDDDNETVSVSTYDIMGNLLTSESDDVKSSYTYDNAGRVLRSSTDDASTRTIYDNLGREIWTISSPYYNAEDDCLVNGENKNTYNDINVGKTYTYNSVDQLVEERSDLGVETDYAYYSNGNKMSEKFDQYDYRYNSDTTLRKVFVSGVSYAAYEYDSDKNNTKIAYGNGDIVRYEYDDNNNPIKQFRDKEKTPCIEFAYNDDNELVSKTDYDSMRKTYYTDGAVSSISVMDDNGAETQIFTASAENEEETDSFSYQLGSQQYSYTATEEKASLVYNNYTFDIINENDDNLSSSTIIKTTDYYTQGVLRSNYTNDDNGNIISFSFDVPEGSANSEQKGNAYTISYDDENRIVSYGLDDSVNTFTYDDNGRLVREDNQLGSSYTKPIAMTAEAI
ncbi:MAG: hypothetical protein NC397_10450 [Clostridium sp.]|nr:hypothetical protein [Clostridium sp.]